ncbi:collagen alpha-1(I) chain-like, partial [Acinonyx jubatus]|uniref:Collagen alpha-1(I) chain-like n=1 Tax=Acinonyx jubatus TaxID=32536 RepID=A0ABM3NW79_ACIJB
MPHARFHPLPSERPDAVRCGAVRCGMEAEAGVGPSREQTARVPGSVKAGACATAPCQGPLAPPPPPARGPRRRAAAASERPDAVRCGAVRCGMEAEAGVGPSREQTARVPGSVKAGACATAPCQGPLAPPPPPARGPRRRAAAASERPDAVRCGAVRCGMEAEAGVGPSREQTARVPGSVKAGACATAPCQGPLAPPPPPARGPRRRAAAASERPDAVRCGAVRCGMEAEAGVGPSREQTARVPGSVKAGACATAPCQGPLAPPPPPARGPRRRAAAASERPDAVRCGAVRCGMEAEAGVGPSREQTARVPGSVKAGACATAPCQGPLAPPPPPARGPRRRAAAASERPDAVRCGAVRCGMEAEAGVGPSREQTARVPGSVKAGACATAPCQGPLAPPPPPARGPRRRAAAARQAAVSGPTRCGAVRRGAVRDGSGGGRGAKPGADCKSPGIGEGRGLRHSALPGSSCAASATRPGPAAEGGGSQAGSSERPDAVRCGAVRCGMEAEAGVGPSREQTARVPGSVKAGACATAPCQGPLAPPPPPARGPRRRAAAASERPDAVRCGAVRCGMEAEAGVGPSREQTARVPGSVKAGACATAPCQGPLAPPPPPARGPRRRAAAASERPDAVRCGAVRCGMEAEAGVGPSREQTARVPGSVKAGACATAPCQGPLAPPPPPARGPRRRAAAASERPDAVRCGAVRCGMEAEAGVGPSREQTARVPGSVKAGACATAPCQGPLAPPPPPARGPRRRAAAASERPDAVRCGAVRCGMEAEAGVGPSREQTARVPGSVKAGACATAPCQGPLAPPPPPARGPRRRAAAASERPDAVRCGAVRCGMEAEAGVGPSREQTARVPGSVKAGACATAPCQGPLAPPPPPARGPRRRAAAASERPDAVRCGAVRCGMEAEAGVGPSREQTARVPGSVKAGACATAPCQGPLAPPPPPARGPRRRAAAASERPDAVRCGAVRCGMEAEAGVGPSREQTARVPGSVKAGACATAPCQGPLAPPPPPARGPRRRAAAASERPDAVRCGAVRCGMEAEAGVGPSREQTARVPGSVKAGACATAPCQGPLAPPPPPARGPRRRAAAASERPDAVRCGAVRCGMEAEAGVGPSREQTARVPGSVKAGACATAPCQGPLAPPPPPARGPRRRAAAASERPDAVRCGAVRCGMEAEAGVGPSREQTARVPGSVKAGACATAPCQGPLAPPPPPARGPRRRAAAASERPDAVRCGAVRCGMEAEAGVGPSREQTARVPGSVKAGACATAPCQGPLAPPPPPARGPRRRAAAASERPDAVRCGAVRCGMEAEAGVGPSREQTARVPGSVKAGACATAPCQGPLAPPPPPARGPRRRAAAASERPDAVRCGAVRCGMEAEAGVGPSREQTARVPGSVKAGACATAPCQGPLAPPPPPARGPRRRAAAASERPDAVRCGAVRCGMEAEAGVGPSREQTARVPGS